MVSEYMLQHPRDFHPRRVSANLEPVGRTGFQKANDIGLEPIRSPRFGQESGELGRKVCKHSRKLFPGTASVNWRRCQIAPSGCRVSRYLLITGRATLLSLDPRP